MFESTLTDKLVIVIDKRNYRRDDTIGYRVHNSTDQVVWFQDQSFGVQAFAYDTVSKQWVEVDLGFWIADPMPKGIEPGKGGVLDYYALWVDTIDVPQDGKIRLVITGHTDLENPVLDRIYTAYTDIEVVQ